MTSKTKRKKDSPVTTPDKNAPKRKKRITATGDFDIQHKHYYYYTEIENYLKR